MEFAPRTLDAEPDGVLSLQAGGRRLTVEDRDRIIHEIRSGNGPTRLTVEALVYLQRDAPNRNFVRFKKGILGRLAKSFVGRPVLRDHAQQDLGAVAGRITSSELVEHKGVPAIAQTLELVKPWAIEAALDGTISTFSIGWNNTDDVECSACGVPMARSVFGAMPACSHFPGDKLEGKDGAMSVVEMVVTGAEGVEVSAVSVPAVPGTGIGEIRSALAAARSGHNEAAEKIRAAIKAGRKPQEKIMKLIASKLGLSEDANEEAMGNAIDTLAARGSAATEALAARDREIVDLKNELSGFRKSEHEAKLAALLDQVRAKVGPKIGAEGKPILGGTETEKRILAIAEKDMALASSIVADLPQIIVGGKLRSLASEPPPSAPPGLLSADEKERCRKLNISEESYLVSKLENASRRRGRQEEEE